jgi:hypothetical protein
MKFEPIINLKGWLEDAGFVNVTEKIFHVPVGIWPQDKRAKELGLWNQARLWNRMADFTERRMKNFMGVNVLPLVFPRRVRTNIVERS